MKPVVLGIPCHRILLCVVAVLALGGCSKSLKWTEDVLLPDGRTVTLTRYQEFKGWRDIGEEATESDYWFEFKNPDTGERVRWNGDRDLGTAALMMSEKTPYLLVVVWFGGGKYRLNCPNPPYFLYGYKNKQWEKVDLGEIPVKQFRSNMTFSPGDFKREIENTHHRSVEQTQDSRILNMKRWYMDFSRFKEQSFGMSNCSKEDDYFLASPSK